MLKYNWIVIGLAATTGGAAIQAQTVAPPVAATSSGSLPIEEGEGRAVAAKLGDELVRSFVFRDKAEDYAAMLRRNAATGRYDRGTREDLATLMTDDLLAVHKDGHLRVMLAADRRGGPGGPGGGPPRNWPALIQSAKTLAPGIGYIKFTAFMGQPEELATLKKWLSDNVEAKTLIFDLRNHHGGGLEEQDAIFSYLYGRKTPLVKMAITKDVYERRGSPLEGSATLVFALEGDKMVATHSAIPGPETPLRRAKVYVLTSNRTASAAEHFAQALKTTSRAILVGEATAGANHFGGPAPINDHFDVWLPIGRTYDIKTGKDWEGEGIIPDIAIEPAQALVVALEKAGLSHEDAVKLDAQEVPAEPVHSDKLRAR